MPRMQFIDAKFPPANELSPKSVINRLERHQRKLMQQRAEQNAEAKPDDEGGDFLEESDPPFAAIPEEIQKRIRRRACDLVERQQKDVSPMSQLPEKDLKLLRPVRHGVEMIPIASEHRADEIAAAVHADFPWMAEVTEALWKAMRLSVQREEFGFRMAPLLLDGPPGIGKSAWARAVARQVGLPTVAIDAGAENAGFGVAGVQRGWGSAQPGRPISLILQRVIGNPILVIDEIDKAGHARDDNGEAHSLTAALLPLLERETSVGWNCPYFRVPANMSWISWILTCNNAERIPAPLRSRCTEFRLRELTTEQLVGVVVRQQAVRGLSGEITAGIVEALEQRGRTTRPPSLRTVIRMLDVAERAAARPVLH